MKFDEMDLDKSGTIQLTEAKVLTQRVFPELPEVHPFMTRWFLGADDNNSGELNFSEFVQFFAFLLARLVVYFYLVKDLLLSTDIVPKCFSLAIILKESRLTNCTNSI